jgi:superfamily II DNA or RNA helicase
MYYYNDMLDEDSPIIEQNKKISLPLKKHQLAGICKAYKMEQEERIYHNDEINENSYYEITTNIGIIGEKVGYGKTITALAIIAHSPINTLKINNSSLKSYNTQVKIKQTDIIKNAAIISNIQKYDTEVIRNKYINTTLVIVPRGPVYTQWVRSIQNDTKLSVLLLDDIRIIKKIEKPNDNNIERIKKYFERFDLVLIKNTTLRKFMNYMEHNSFFIKYWARVIVDEAHDILMSIGNISFLYKWLISATYTNLLNIRYCVNANVYLIRELIKNELNHILIKSKDSFIKKSFDLPPIIEKTYKCKMLNRLSVIRPYLSRSQIERLNASDLLGIMREIGGNVATENGIIECFTNKLNKDLHNKKCEKNMIEHMALSDEEKEQKYESINKVILLLESKIEDLTVRISNISDKNCAICLDNLTNPLILNCTHSYCATCIMMWIKTNKKCPECRKEINIADTTFITNNTITTPNDKVKIKSKENTLIDIINNKKEGKFLIFSKIENGFSNIINNLNNHDISYTEIKGTTSCMNNILERFRKGEIKVILLNTNYAGSGIDISFATDVIIYHSMNNERTQAIGRAHRVGRINPLYVHTLLYEEETQDENY